VNLSRVLVASLLLLTPAVPAFAAEDESIESVLIKMATTPEQHRALADYYRGKAADARRDAANHKAMAASYAGTKLAYRLDMQEHCNKIIANDEALAKEYDALAAMHDADAKKP
jgi:hypothetical protein